MSRCVTCLCDLPAFDGLPLEEFKDICLNATKRTLKKGEYLFHQAEPADTIYLIKNGNVKLVQLTETGKEKILDVVRRGQVLGEEALFRKQNNLYDAIALENVNVCLFSLPNFEALIKTNPNIALSIISNLGEKLYSTLQQLGATANHSVEDRLLALLFRLASEHGKETPGGQLIQLKLTQEDIANMIGASRVMVAQIIRQFKQKDFLAKEGKYYIIKDQCLTKNFRVERAVL